MFKENNATNAGALFVGGHASVIFNKSSVVTFSKNIVANQGGAVFVSNQAMISFEQNSIAVFNSKRAVEGGAVYSIIIKRQQCLYLCLSWRGSSDPYDPWICSWQYFCIWQTSIVILCLRETSL